VRQASEAVKKELTLAARKIGRGLTLMRADRNGLNLKKAH
jgi:hypothetical protein